MKATQPIGIFDSGLGGLTVARAVAQQLPSEKIIYFGDTLHLPYGDKPSATIQTYVKQIANFLVSQSVKLVLIACNAASAAAADMLSNYLTPQTLLVNVIDPMVGFIQQRYANESLKRIGLIGTRLTVESMSYQYKLQACAPTIQLQTLATPLLVPLIEEGWDQHPVLSLVLAEYLASPQLTGIEALILGCTHYPLIQSQIAAFYQCSPAPVMILNSAAIVAAAVQQQLSSANLLATTTADGGITCYVSALTPAFSKIARLFFGTQLELRVRNIFME